MFIATLIAAERLARGDISAAEDALGGTLGREWVEEGRACDLLLDGGEGARTALEGLIAGVDVVIQPETGRRKRLLAADMDSTMIAVECIDELADFAGVRAEVATITEQAMRGELDFEAALDARVALLRGLAEEEIDRCRGQRVTLTPGARILVRTMRAHGAFTLLVSGGFTRFAEPVATAIGFDSVAANHLDIADGRVAGTVRRPVVGAEGKRKALIEAGDRYRIAMRDALAVGDGANDVPMLREAGLGVAYRAKPGAAAAANARIDNGDLTALLYAQGYPRREWVED